MLTKEVANAPQATADATTRATAEESNVKVLEADLVKHKTNVSRRSTKISAEDVHIAKLEGTCRLQRAT